MSLIIKKQSGVIGSLGKEKILINGQHVESIANNSQVEIELKHSPSTFSLKSVPKSTKQVKDGDTLIITANPAYFIGIAIFIVFAILGNIVFVHSRFGAILSSMGFLSILLSFLFVPRYKFNIEPQ